MQDFFHSNPITDRKNDQKETVFFKFRGSVDYCCVSPKAIAICSKKMHVTSLSAPSFPLSSWAGVSSSFLHPLSLHGPESPLRLFIPSPLTGQGYLTVSSSPLPSRAIAPSPPLLRPAGATTKKPTLTASALYLWGSVIT